MKAYLHYPNSLLPMIGIGSFFLLVSAVIGVLTTTGFSFVPPMMANRAHAHLAGELGSFGSSAVLIGTGLSLIVLLYGVIREYHGYTRELNGNGYQYIKELSETFSALQPCVKQIIDNNQKLNYFDAQRLEHEAARIAHFQIKGDLRELCDCPLPARRYSSRSIVDNNTTVSESSAVTASQHAGKLQKPDSGTGKSQNVASISQLHPRQKNTKA